MSKEIRGREKFNKYRKLLLLMYKISLLLPLKIRLRFFEHFRMTQGMKGLAIRYVLLKSIAKHCGDNISIHPGVYIFNPSNLYLNNNISIQPMSYIDATGEIVIGNDVSIAHGATIMSSSHNYKALDTPIKDQGVSLKKTIINDNVWIGAKATILYGVTIRQGTIIAANTVVNKNVDENSIMSGQSMHMIKKRV